MTILDAMRDPGLFGRWFDSPSWRAWRTFLASLFGLGLDDSDLELYRSCTGRTVAPTEPAREGWVIVGRRGGKSRVAALAAVFLACFRDYGDVLAPGEVGTLPIIAADRRQARTIMRYVVGFLESVPVLRKMIVNRTRESVELSNRVVIEVHTASFRAIRGYTLVAAILDELAFWPTDDAADPDHEILAGIRPGMATVPGSVLLCISSPYARRGELWNAYNRHFGEDGDPVLVWQAETATMNPTVPAHVIADAYAEDETSAAAEYGAQFRRDVEGFLSREVIAGCVVPDRSDLPHDWRNHYAAFVDPSGGVSDSMTLAIGHKEQDGRVVVDALKEIRAPFNPDAAVGTLAETLRAYRVNGVTGDRYGGTWPSSRFSAKGIYYRPSEKPKSELYLDALPVLSSGRVELPDHPRLIAQLSALERRTSRGGKDSIDHPPRGHDDLANVVCGLIANTARPYLCGTALVILG